MIRSKSTQHESSPAQLQAVLYDANKPGQPIDIEQFDIGSISDKQLLWIDFQSSEDKLPAGLTQLVDDPRVLRGLDTEPGVDSNSYWYSLRALALAEGDPATPRGEPLLIAVGPNMVITLHRAPIAFLTAMLEHEADNVDVGVLTADSFAASLLDRLLTSYFDAIDDFESAVDKLELAIFHHRVRSDRLSQLQQLRRTVARLRRLLAVHRDLFQALSRPDFRPKQAADVTAHFTALDQRFDKVIEAVQNARDLVIGSFELLAMRIAERTNETMRVLTFMTVLLGTLAVLAGVLGMNFRAPFFDRGEGFWWAVGLMLMLAAGALVVARRRGWW